MYGIVKSTDKEGIVVMHTRLDQAQANELAATIAVEQAAESDWSEVAVKMFRDDVIQTLQTHGCYVGRSTNSFQVVVMQLLTEPPAQIPYGWTKEEETEVTNLLQMLGVAGLRLDMTGDHPNYARIDDAFKKVAEFRIKQIIKKNRTPR